MTAGGIGHDPRPEPSPRRRLALGVALVVAIAGFSALGVWQLERRVWKLGLIAAIDARIHAPAVAAPGPAAWPGIDAAHDAYRRVQADGVYIPGRDTLVQAVTALGGGYWVMTPLRTGLGFTILVNRGFVPSDHREAAANPGTVQVTGLLRITEPWGGFLRANDPASDQWHSRDVAAIAKARGLGDVAPYFIDADAAPGNPDGPVGGLTVVALPNNHLVYAATWFTLAAMSAGAGVAMVRDAYGRAAARTSFCFMKGRPPGAPREPTLSRRTGPDI